MRIKLITALLILFIFNFNSLPCISDTIANPEQLKIVVSNVDEFIKAIGPDRTIILKPGIYNLSEVKDVMDTEYVEWAYYSGDPAKLVIKNLKDLTISGDKEFPSKIVTNSRLDVIDFKNVDNVTLQFIISGHVPKKFSDCVGAVLSFIDSKNIKISDSTMFGSGTIGLDLNNVQNLTFDNSVIRECSVSGTSITDSDNIKFTNSNFVNNDLGVLISIDESQNILFEKCKFNNNNIDNFLHLSHSCKDAIPRIIIKNSSIINNKIKEKFIDDDLSVEKFEDTQIENKPYD